MREIGMISLSSVGLGTMFNRKLPRPTRSLPPCGGRSLLEDGAFPQRHCAPRPHAWTRPGFLLPSSSRRGCNVCCVPLRPGRGLSRRFNSQCSLALPQNGDGIRTRSRSSFPSAGCEDIRPRITGASLLVAPPDPDLCEDGSVSCNGWRRAKLCGFAQLRNALLPALPVGRSSDLNDGGSALSAKAELPHPVHSLFIYRCKDK